MAVPERSYTATAPPVALVWGLPIRTLIATCLAGVCYLISLILVASNCALSLNLHSFQILVLCCLGIGAIIFMFSISVRYRKYRFDWLCLTASLCYAGSASMIIYAAICGAFAGKICQSRVNSQTLETVVSVNWIGFVILLLGSFFQIVSYYYYG